MNEKDFRWAIPSSGHLKRILEKYYALDSIQEQIVYLTNESTFFKHKSFLLGDRVSFEIRQLIDFLDLEILKLKEKRELEKINKKNEKPKKDISIKNRKNKELTLDRATLVFAYLFKYLKVDSPNTDKAKFISFLTGFSENTIRQKLSKLHEKADSNFVKYEKDMEIVCKYFESLGLDEIVKMISNDLEM